MNKSQHLQVLQDTCAEHNADEIECHINKIN
jgi:hypothetical protein